MVSVKFEGVSKRYEDGFEAVSGLDLEVRDGEFLVLLGPSGCGKSTTLRMLAGLEEVTDGAVSIDGVVVNHLPAGARGLGMVFQSYALYPHMSVYQNLAYGLKNRGVDKDTINRKITQVAKTLKIEDYLQRKPAKLSGGQRQRVAIGRSIVQRPRGLLFDEPLSNLDAKLRVQMRTSYPAAGALSRTTAGTRTERGSTS